jgi:cell division transport system ATP-binding protein
MIQFRNVSKCYPGGHEALTQVDFHLQREEMAFLTGRSGAGKSTLLRLICLMERPSRGQVIVDGKDLSGLSTRDVPFLRRQMGIIFQTPELLGDRTVFDNVALPLILAGVRHQEIGRSVRAALDQVGLLSKERLNPTWLSVGEQQRLGIARAIVNKPALLVADEPTGNLDPQLAEEIMGLFMQLNRVGVSVLIATHDLALIATMNRRVLTLKEGKLL